jgi:hypothetical protein
MYPSEELNQLARRKVILRGSIAVNRWRCVASAHRVAEPLKWVDRGIELWQKFSPFLKFGALPLGLLFKKVVLPRSNVASGFGSILRWAPAAFSAFKAFRTMRAKASGDASSSTF